MAARASNRANQHLIYQAVKAAPRRPPDSLRVTWTFGAGGCKKQVPSYPGILYGIVGSPSFSASNTRVQLLDCQLACRCYCHRGGLLRSSSLTYFPPSDNNNSTATSSSSSSIILSTLHTTPYYTNTTFTFTITIGLAERIIDRLLLPSLAFSHPSDLFLCLNH